LNHIFLIFWQTIATYLFRWPGLVDDLQIANLRHSRLPACATRGAESIKKFLASASVVAQYYFFYGGTLIEPR
jgi:hypothetical protein